MKCDWNNEVELSADNARTGNVQNGRREIETLGLANRKQACASKAHDKA